MIQSYNIRGPPNSTRSENVDMRNTPCSLLLHGHKLKLYLTGSCLSSRCLVHTVDSLKQHKVFFLNKAQQIVIHYTMLFWVPPLYLLLPQSSTMAFQFKLGRVNTITGLGNSIWYVSREPRLAMHLPNDYLTAPEMKFGTYLISFLKFIIFISFVYVMHCKYLSFNYIYC